MGPLVNWIDIVLDLNGKPWVIEANGNPVKIAIFIQKAVSSLAYSYI
jgi:hypothetical protein